MFKIIFNSWIFVFDKKAYILEIQKSLKDFIVMCTTWVNHYWAFKNKEYTLKYCILIIIFCSDSKMFIYNTKLILIIFETYNHVLGVYKCEPCRD